MFKAKYVIVDGSAIVFSAAIQHKSMVGYEQKADGAGFVRFITTKNQWGGTEVVAECYGESISLGIPSRPELDSQLVTQQITNPEF